MQGYIYEQYHTIPIHAPETRSHILRMVTLNELKCNLCTIDNYCCYNVYVRHAHIFLRKINE